MATFFTNLFSNIFTPGANSALIIATHASFAALQATLAGLLITTKSWHFVFLSLLSGGLWGSITWFIGAVEEEANRLEEEARRVRRLKKEHESSASENEGDGAEKMEKKDE